MSCAAGVEEVSVQKMEAATLPRASAMFSLRPLLPSPMSQGELASLGRYCVGSGVSAFNDRDDVERTNTGELIVLPHTTHEKVAFSAALDEPERTKTAAIATADEEDAADADTGICGLLVSCSRLGFSLYTVFQLHVICAAFAKRVLVDVVERIKLTVLLAYVSATMLVEGDAGGGEIVAPFRMRGTGGSRTRSPFGTHTHSLKIARWSPRLALALERPTIEPSKLVAVALLTALIAMLWPAAADGNDDVDSANAATEGALRETFQGGT